MLGLDWAKLIGLEEQKLSLKITELQGQALVEGNLTRADQLEKQREFLRTELEIEALTQAIIKAEARVLKYADDKVLSVQAENQLQDLKNAKLERELGLREKLSTAGNNALRDDVEAAIAFGKIVQNVEALEKKLTPTQELLNGIGGQLTNAFGDGIALAVSGVDRLGEAFQDLAADILEAIGKQLILSAITQGIGALAGNDGKGLFSMLNGSLGELPGRANGGNVTAGSPYKVGERGEELFIPGKSGTVVPADVFAATKEAMDTGSISSDAFEENAEAIGVARSFAENNQSLNTTNNYMRGQSEIAALESAYISKENDTIRVEVDTVNVGGLDVVTTEQFAAGMQATAKQARAQVFSDMKNKPAVRAQVGIR